MQMTTHFQTHTVHKMKITTLFFQTNTGIQLYKQYHTTPIYPSLCQTLPSGGKGKCPDHRKLTQTPIACSATGAILATMVGKGRGSSYSVDYVLHSMYYVNWKLTLHKMPSTSWSHTSSWYHRSRSFYHSMMLQSLQLQPYLPYHDTAALPTNPCYLTTHIY